MTQADPADPMCPICDEHRPLVRHHCHLLAAVEGAMKSALHSSLGRALGDARMKCNSHWALDPRVRDVQRFADTRMCDDCNSLDNRDLTSRPGPYFSLSPLEMREVRDCSRGAKRESHAALIAIRSLRLAATQDYRERYAAALLLGRWMAAELIDLERWRARWDILETLGDEGAQCMTPDDWADYAARPIYKAMAAGKLSFDELALRLQGRGYESSGVEVQKRLKSGRFSATFLMQCLSALDVPGLEVPDVERDSTLAEEGRDRRRVAAEKRGRRARQRSSIRRSRAEGGTTPTIDPDLAPAPLT